MRNEAPQPLSLKRNVLWNTFGCLFYQGCLWLITIVVVWLSGYQDAGVLALAMAIGNVFEAVALYKMRTFQVSDVTGEHSQPNYAALRLITVGIAFVVLVPYTILTTPTLQAILCICAFLLFKADVSVADFLYGVDQRANRMDYIGISQLIRGFVSLGGFAAGLWLTGSLLAAIMTMFVGCALVTLLYDIPHARRFAALRPSIDAAHGKRLLLSGLPAVLAVVLNMAVVAISRQFLGNLLGDEILGIYASISTPAVLMQAAVGYLYTPMIGGLSENWTNGSRGDLLRFLGKMVLVVGGSLAVCSGLLIAVGPWLLVLVFGESIAPSLYIFPYSILCTAMIALISLSVDVLIVFRRAKGALVSCAAAFVVALATAVPAIDTFAINGINLSISLAYAVGIVIAGTLIAHAVQRRAAERSRD